MLYYSEEWIKIIYMLKYITKNLFADVIFQVIIKNCICYVIKIE